MRSPSKESPLPSESFPSYRQSSPTPTGSNFSKRERAISSNTLRQVKRSDLAIGYTVFYGRISTIVPFGANLLISSISSSVTAIHPFVQSTSV